MAVVELFLLALQVQYSSSGWGCYSHWGYEPHDPDTYDPCLDGNHHLITDPTKSADYYDPDSPLLHDYNYYNYDESVWEKNGWYRSVIPGAEDIALERPEYGHCQAERHIYFDAQHNNYIDEAFDGVYVVELTNTDYGCCDYICMRHCENFNVYQLAPFYYYDWWHDYSRVCFGGDGTCKEDDELCKSLFKTRNRPQISYTSNQKVLGGGICTEEVEFQCQVNKWANDTNVSMVKYVWSIENIILHEEVNQGTNHSSTLTLEQVKDTGISQLNFQLECSIQWSMTTNSSFGDVVSTTFYVGLQTSKSSMELTEGQSPQQIELTSSIPIGCEYPCSERETHVCTFQVPLTYSSNGVNEIAFQFDDSYDNTRSCERSLSVTGTSALGTTLGVPITIFPKDDGKYDGTQKVDVEIYLTSGDELLNEIPSSLQVLVHDINSDYGRGKKCYFVNDPHVGNFDGSHFELQLEGIFQIFRHKDFPIEIEAYFKNYGRYTGVCGVAVRSGGFLYAVRQCRKKAIAKFYQCESTSSATSLLVKQDGERFDIYLPTGTKVEFREGNLNIYPSSSDVNNVEGICGNYNDDRSDDFKIRYTNEFDRNTRAPNDFSNSWRIGEMDSLFQGNITDDGSRTFEDREFCECDFEGIRRCSPLPVKNIVYKGMDVPATGHCQEIKREIVYSDYVMDEDEFVFDYDPSFVAPTPEWHNGWSQETAENYCNDSFSSDEILQSCAELIDIDDGLANCYEDIYITGTTNYTKTQIDMLLSQCIAEVDKYDVVNLEEGSNYTNPYQDLLESVCYSNCNGNGVCENGVCQCLGNYTGFDCSVDKYHIPTLQPFPFHGLCDKASRPCQATGVYADLLVASDNLKCQVQAKDLEYTPLSELEAFDGEIEHFQKVFCPIPDEVLPYIVGIAVTNNREYSDPQHLLVYHSTCWQCSLDNGCEKKMSSCVIDHSCIAPGESNPSNADEHCDPESDEYGWSSQSSSVDESQNLSRGAMIGIAVACAVVVMGTIFLTIFLCKLKSNKKATRVASEVDFGKSNVVEPKFLAENQNSIPPTQVQVDFKTLNARLDATPYNRLEPLDAPQNMENPDIVSVKPAFYAKQSLDPIASMVDDTPKHL